MKGLFLATVTALCFGTVAFAQDSEVLESESQEAASQSSLIPDGYSTFHFYGVDFRDAKVVKPGDDDTLEDFQECFEGINKLFLSAMDKFVSSMEKKFGIEFSSISVAEVIAGLADLDELDLFQLKTGSLNNLSWTAIQYDIRSLGIRPCEGLGLLIVAGEINKGTKTGTWYYAFFDNNTLELLSCGSGSGKAIGIGTRNAWAASLYSSLKSLTAGE